MQDRISIAAEMVGNWWAARLHPQHIDKRGVFATAVAVRVEGALRGQWYWTLFDERKPGGGTPLRDLYTECDYEPQGLLLDAVREVIEPGYWGSWAGLRSILPAKHELGVDTDAWVLRPKEGYGNRTDNIKVPTPEAHLMARLLATLDTMPGNCAHYPALPG